MARLGRAVVYVHVTGNSRVSGFTNALESIDFVETKAVVAGGGVALVDVGFAEPAGVSRRTVTEDVVEQVLAGRAGGAGARGALVDVCVAYLACIS